MIERVLENWLDNASEKSFQVPFCYMLANEGYEIIHMSRHCGMEMGKDIIALSPENVPCAFQLKGGTGKRITLNQWNALSNQINALMMNKIVHPSISINIPHESWFVTNKDLDEEVSRSIDDLNRGWIERGQPNLKLKTIVRGKLLRKAHNLGAGMWPEELKDIKSFLEHYLLSGRENLPKHLFVKVLEAILPITKPSNTPKEYCKRAISAGALISALAITPFSNTNNHFALIEAWTLYISYVLAVVERYNLAQKYWLSSFRIAMNAIKDSLGRLCDELIERDNLVEGNPFLDPLFYKCRITTLIAMLSIYALWRRMDGDEFSDHDEFIAEFCKKNRHNMELWGEYAIPQFLSFYWYFINNDSTPAPDFLIADLIDAVTYLKNPYNENGLPDPYYSYDDLFGEKKLNEYSFTGYSYMLEGLVHLFIRTNWKQKMKWMWPDVSKISYESFVVEKKWHYYLWRNNRGTQLTRISAPTQNWEDLKKLAFEKEGKNLPKLLKKYPVLFSLFLCVFPHRANSESIRYLDSMLFRNKS